MTRKLQLLVFLLTVSLNATAQKYDNKWMMGYNYGAGFAQPALDFYYGYPDTIGYFGTINMFGNSASICNSQGLLQFYTNGLLVSNAWDQPLSNSTNFNSDPATNGAGYFPIDQAVLILPEPGSSNTYCIFHHNFVQTGNNINPTELRMSKVDMTLQNGLGEMTLKKQVVISDILTFRTLNAVKHGNGRDWWIVISENGTDQFYSVLLTPNGIDTIVKSGNGPTITNGLVRAQSVFSPDGSHYAYCTFDGQTQNTVVLYDFDRCTGQFNYNDSLNYSLLNDSLLTGCSFSSNSRYLYVCSSLSLFQFDLVNNNLDSVTHIDDFDMFLDFNFVNFGKMQLAPDNKIYIINTGGSTHYMHVINQPDSAGTTSDFIQHQLRLIGYHSGTMPFFPHYRLGPAVGSVCDSINVTAITETQQEETPACYYQDGMIQLSLTQPMSCDGAVSIYSLSGVMLKSIQVPKFSSGVIQISGLIRSPGIYLVNYKTSEKNYGWKIPVFN